MHIECRDKTNYIVEHCDCDPDDPNDRRHRHIYHYEDLIDPPPLEALGDMERELIESRARSRSRPIQIPQVVDPVTLHQLLMQTLAGAHPPEAEMQYSPCSSYEVTLARSSYSPTEVEKDGQQNLKQKKLDEPRTSHEIMRVSAIVSNNCFQPNAPVVPRTRSFVEIGIGLYRHLE